MSTLVARLVAFDYSFALAPFGGFASFQSFTATPGSLTESGSRRAYVLKTIHDVIVSAELEKRLRELDDRRAGMSGGRISSSSPAGMRRLN